MGRLRDRTLRFFGRLIGCRAGRRHQAPAGCTARAPLNELGQEIVKINTANGWSVTTPESWGEQYKIPAVLALVTSEVSEALEAFRHNDLGNFAEECADTIIRVLDLAAGLGLDMDRAVREKLEKNKTRGHRHGGKRV